ncbi:MAG: peptide ABC transporter permease [actinobacterium acAMD-5]|nr:MAG: peptide ABC transporter permease [actinobacterium acAMD-5]
MASFILKRFANFIVLVVIATTAGYLLAAIALNPRENFLGRNPPVPEYSINSILDNVNMNDQDPVLERYGTWVSGVIKGDLGLTIFSESVNNEFKNRIWVSFRLLILGSIFGAVFGVLIGVISAVRQYKFFDRTFGYSSYVILSTPVFLIAILLKLFAVFINDKLGFTLFYTVGMNTPELTGSALFVNSLQHMILPSLALILGGVAFYSRWQRNSMLDVLGSDHLRTARAKGLNKRQALFKHGLRVAILPMATFFAYSFGLLIAGAAFTEQIFGWYGMGEWFIRAVNTNDINSVSAIVLFTAVLVLFAGFLADVLVAALDPRVRIR